MKDELTTRQREALIAIYALTLRNGAGPTLREMREEMDVASDQTVIEMLERLEKIGFVARDKKQARGISLTEKAKLKLGIVSAKSATSAGPMELDEQQRKVHEQLAGIEPRLGQMYKGALSTLRDLSNEDRIAQSAHSLREVIAHLSNMGTAVIPPEERARIKEDRGTRQTIHGLRYLFDPQASVEVEKNPYKHLYDDYQTKLQDISHHNVRPNEEDYFALIKNMEYFLLRYVFPSQVEVYRLLEDTLRKGPDGVDANDLRFLVKKNVESNRFFFKHADARWLSYLRGHGFLEASWEVGEYLSRVALDEPGLVLEIFLATEMPKDAWGAKTSFAEAVSKLPHTYAAQAVQKIIDGEWAKEVRATMLHYKLRDLLNNLLKGKDFKQAIILSDALLDIFPQEYGTHGMRDTRGYVSEYEYGKIIEDLGAIPPEELPPFLKMLSTKLITMLTTVHVRREESEEDYSYIWRPAIEDHAQNHPYDRMDDSIIVGVRELLQKRIGYLVELGRIEDARRELDEVLDNKPMYSLLVRYKLHIYRLYPDAFNAEVEREIINPRLSGFAWHEYSLLAEEHFSRISAEGKKNFFDFIDKLDTKDDEYADSWRARLVDLVKEDLTAEQKKKYATLLKNAAGLEEPHFTTYHSDGTSFGPDSPKKESDLENMPVSEVVELIKTWEPTGDEFFGPSHSGLGMALRNVVAKEGVKYSAAAALFLGEGVRPVYIYNFFSGFAEAAKDRNTKLEWGPVLDLAANIIARAKGGTLLPIELDKKGRPETDWDDVMQEISRVIVRGLDTNGISLADKERVWAIIEHVVESPDPTPEQEEKYGGNNSDPYTLSINTVRGEAFHAVFAYIFWFNRAEKTTEKTWSARIPDEAKKVLENHLNPAHDPSLSIRSVYGRFFPWMLSYGGDWAKDLIPKVFPADDTALRYAAWETYLSNQVFSEAYKLLRPQYELAVKDIRAGKVPKRKYWVDAVERLAEHAMIAYAFEADDEQDPFYKYFFANASGKCRGMAISLGGRAFISRDNFPAEEKMPKVEIMEKFWDWRLAETDSPSELREFGWWAKLDKFNNKWMLERLLKTVEKTRGDINGEFIVMASLDNLADEHPLLCAKILKHIFASSNRRDRYAFLHMGELRSALGKILGGKNEEAKKTADETIDYLLKLGFEDLRSLSDSKPPRNNQVISTEEEA